MKPTKGKGKKQSKKSVSTENRTNLVASGALHFNEREVDRLMSVLDKRISDLLAELSALQTGQIKYRRLKVLPEHILKAKRDRLMFMLGLDLGTRVNELLSLKWDCIDNQGKDDLSIVFWRIWDEKKDKERLGVVSKMTWDALNNYLSDLTEYQAKGPRSTDLIFPICDKTANRFLKSLAKEIGINRRVRWHMLRHTFVIMSIKRKRGWEFIAQQTGDTVAVLIATYGGLSIPDLQVISDDKPIFQQGVSNT